MSIYGKPVEEIWRIMLRLERLRVKFMEWLHPQPWSVYHGVELYRCDSDRALVTHESGKSQEILRRHAGHRLRSPVILTKREKLLIWLKLIK